MSRRTERPYKVDGAGELARHSAARRSAPEINGPVVQQKFTFLLRETCSPSPSVTVGAVARNGCRAGAGVSRGRSTESNEPANPDGLTTREGLNLAGRTRPSVVLTRSDEADRLSIWAAIIVAEKECCFYPQGLSGTAVRGPACTVVWEPGGETLRATRLAPVAAFNKFHLKYIFGLGHDLRVQEFQAVVSEFWEQELPKLELNPERGAPRARNLDDL